MFTRRVFLLVILLALILTSCSTYRYHGQLLDKPMTISDLVLTDQTGQPRSLQEFKGEVVMVYFGYTFCPDVCPTTLTEMKKTFELLGNKAEEVNFVMVSVDPGRDTPQALGAYLSNFNPTFIGLSGTPDQIADAALPFGVFYEKHEGTAATGYLVDHTASVMVLDRQGRLRLIIPFQTPAEDVAADIKQLLKSSR